MSALNSPTIVLKSVETVATRPTVLLVLVSIAMLVIALLALSSIAEDWQRRLKELRAAVGQHAVQPMHSVATVDFVSTDRAREHAKKNSSESGNFSCCVGQLCSTI